MFNYPEETSACTYRSSA